MSEWNPHPISSSWIQAVHFLKFQCGVPLDRELRHTWILERSGRHLELRSSRTDDGFPAAICYSNCIKYGYDIDVSILNKAEVYLRLGWFHGAFHNAKVAVDSGTLNDDLVKKAVVRMIKAHYGLGRYSAALEAAKTFPKDLNVKELSERAKERLKEQATGEYDWCRLFR